MSFLERLALAHRRHEGWFPGSVSQRNNNPGNLRLTAYQKRAYGAVEGAVNFAKFPSYDVGFRALKDDIRAKMTGHSAHIDYSRNPTFLDYVKVYAPAEDGNNPRSYAQALIAELHEYGIGLDTPLSHIALLLDKPVPSQLQVKTKAVLIRLANRLPEPLRSRLLKRLSDSPS